MKRARREIAGKTVTVPDVTGVSPQQASDTLTAAGLRTMVDGIGQTITDQLPAAGAEVPDGSLVVLHRRGRGAGRRPGGCAGFDPGKSLVPANRALRAGGDCK